MQEDHAPDFHCLKSTSPERENLKCPRCDSINTKFCYYNNYNLSQPRHFCKNCRRYWTKGGALRNIPVGGGSRRTSKRANSRRATSTPAAMTSSTSSTGIASAASMSLQIAPRGEAVSLFGPTIDHDRRMLEFGGSFSSLLASNGNFGNLFEDVSSGDSAFTKVQYVGYSANPNANADTNRIVEPSLETGDSSYWGGVNAWPDLAIYTPGSGFQ